MLNLGYFKVFITFSVTNFRHKHLVATLYKNQDILNIFGQNPML